MHIREIVIEDAPQFLDLRLQLDHDSRFLMLEPGERTTTLEETRAQISQLIAQDNSATFVVEDEGRLVGYLGAYGGQYRRNHHSVYIVVALLSAYTGRGLGTRLFQALEAWARRHGVHRLDLTVMAHNAAGIALYRKMGFEIEGVKRHALRVDGGYVDEYYMAKLLPAPACEATTP